MSKNKYAPGVPASAGLASQQLPDVPPVPPAIYIPPVPTPPTFDLAPPTELPSAGDPHVEPEYTPAGPLALMSNSPEAAPFYGTPVPSVGGLAGFQELATEPEPVGSAASQLAHAVNTDLVRLPPQGAGPRQCAYLVDGLIQEKPADVAAWLRAELASGSRR